MFRFIINAISRALGFSKTEAKGTLVLILIIITGLITSRVLIWKMKNQSAVFSGNPDELEEWIKTVEFSYEEKKEQEEFDKSVYFPQKKYTKKVDTSKSTFEERKKEIDQIKSIVKLDLNMASAAELQQVKGIGPSYSERIVKYRDMLGGFSEEGQLSEVYGLKEDVVFKLLEQFSIQSEVKKIPINSDSLKILAQHPYISYDMAKIILNYRKAHGDYKTPEDLMKIKTIDENVFLRLKPYLE
jgi:competence ComEA-like helix-hairpin-helix protein